MRVLLAGGGSAGHVEPALSVAEALRERGHDVALLGTPDGVEADLVPARGFPLLTINKAAFPRRMNRAAVTFLFRLARALRAARQLMLEYHPAVVVGFGGYVAWPAYVVARFARPRIPIVVFSYDAKPGLANRVAARWTQWRAVGVRSASGVFANATYTGVPLRQSILKVDRSVDRHGAAARLGLDPSARTLVVFGGSLGSAKINAAVTGCAQSILAAGWQVVHITGARNQADFAASGAQNSNGRWLTLQYLERMQDVYAVADLMLCRAGASTCAELVATGTPALLVPYAVGNGEQEHNAAQLLASGGYQVMQDADVTEQNLWRVLASLMNPEVLSAMQARAAQWSAQHRTTDAAHALADLIEVAGNDG